MTAQSSRPQPVSPALAALIGITAAAILTPFVSSNEGKQNLAYFDPARVLTICYGDTSNVHVGERDTDAQCAARLDTQLAAHAGPVLSCTPTLKGRTWQTVAAVDLAYNIGTGAYCKSTVAKRFNARDWRGGCDALLAWSYAGGKQMPGLLARRQRERALCLKDLSA